MLSKLHFLSILSKFDNFSIVRGRFTENKVTDFRIPRQQSNINVIKLGNWKGLFMTTKPTKLSKNGK